MRFLLIPLLAISCQCATVKKEPFPTGEPTKLSDPDPTPSFDWSTTPFKNDAVPLFGQINDSLADRFITAVLTQAISGKSNINIIIDSEGGEIDAAFRIFDFLKSIKTKTTCRVLNKANSGAFLILQSCTIRIAPLDSYLVIHDPMFMGLSKPLQIEQLPKFNEEVRFVTEYFRRTESKRFKIPYKDFCKSMVQHGGSWSLDISYALQMGAIDKVDN